MGGTNAYILILELRRLLLTRIKLYNTLIRLLLIVFLKKLLIARAKKKKIKGN